jgi:eukaryotic-like serine/threonine-protein kinase
MNAKIDPARAEAVFTAAVAKATPGERAAYLDGACHDNPGLRARVEALLRSHEQAGSFLGLPTGEAAATLEQIPFVAERPGGVIGRYKLLQVIGEGGFGVVYMAEQESPVRRKVALKVIKLGMDTGQVVARFEAERQALAMMDHPNIARVLDGGATDSGRPYFVMELVRGVPITQYCDENRLGTAGRLELFIQVCQAVQHAHQKGVIHRDLKPGNVLVATTDGRAVPKVIDFGIAKATQARLTEKTLFTEFRQLIGTPEYMSPEQAGLGGMDLDTRSDVYSLGVLLYELLTGTPPFEPAALRSKAYEEMRRIIKEVEPPKPSTRLTALGETLAAVAERRGTDGRKLQKLLRGELDWVVMRCLEKDRTRRYQTASEVAADVQRHLRNEPVSAGPPGVGYRLGKLLRKHRGPVTAAAALIAALAAGLAVSLAMYARAERLRADAVNARGTLAAALEDVTEERNLKNDALGVKAAALRRSEALRLATQAQALLLSGEDAEVAAALAVEAGRRSDEPITRGAILSAMTQMSTARPLEQRAAAWVRFTPSGLHILAVGGRSDIEVWDAADGRKVRTLEESQLDNLKRVLLDPQGRRLAAIDQEGSIHLWDVQTGGKLKVFEAEGPDHHQNLAFSPDGGRLATVSGRREANPRGRVCVWNLERFERTDLLQAPESFDSVNFSPDGTKLASSSIGRRHVRAWDLASKQLLLEKVVEDGLPWPTVLFSHDGNRVLDLGRQAIHVWDLGGGEMQRLTAPDDPRTYNGYGYEYHPDAGLLLASSVVKGSIGHAVRHGGPARLWDLKSLTLKQSFGDDRHRVSHATTSADGRFLATVVEERDVEVWNTATGKREATLRGRPLPIEALALSPDGKTVVTVHKGGAASLWDVEDRGVLPTYPRPAHFPIILGDGKRLAELDWDSGEISVLDARSLRTQRRLAPGGWKKHPLMMSDRNYVAYDADADRFAVRSSESEIVVIDGASGRVLTRFEREFKAGGASAEFMAFTAAGRRLLLRYESGEVELLDPATGASVSRVKGIPGPDGWYHRTFAVRPDARRFLITLKSQPDDGYEFHVHDAESGELVRKLDHRKARALLAVAFAPGDRLLATVFEQVTFGIRGQPDVRETDVNLWDLRTGDRVAVLRAPKESGRIRTLAFSADGKTLLSGDGGGTVRLWDVGAGNERLAFAAHTGPVTSAHFDGTSSRLATAGSDGAAVWDARTGGRLFDVPSTSHGPERADAEFQRLEFVSGGEFLMTDASGGLLQCWPTDPLGYMLARGTRPLTPEERRRFVVEELR